MSVDSVGNLQRILDTTLESFLELVRCDAGSVYTVRKARTGEQVLQFEAMITRSINLHGVPQHLRTLQFKIDESSVVGQTAVDRRPVLLNLVCKESQVSTAVGEILSYNTRNMFSGPLITPRG